MDHIRLAIIGLGRIGKVHLENICTRIDGASVVAVMNPSPAGRAFASKFHVPKVTSDPKEIFNDPSIDAVIICSPTHTHADYVTQAARSGKAVFCEKPLDLSLDKTRETLQAVNTFQIPLMLAFNQRFDPSFANVKNYVDSGKIGKIYSLHIVSRDPAPPPLKYIENSGGLFTDMTIHDFDMARHIMQCEVIQVFAKGHNLIDPEIGKAGDIDTGVLVLTFENNATALIENSRKAVYGYDQRLEVFGSVGMMRAENPLKNTNQYFDVKGAHLARHADFFMDRYASSYLIEMEVFLEAFRKKSTMPVSGEDGLKAMIIADAANRSMKENRPINISKDNS